MDISHFQQRRARLMDRLRALGGGIALIQTAPEVPRNRDSDYPYRYDSSFYWLTGFEEPEAALVLDSDANTATLYCREKEIEKEIWDGYRYGPDAAKTEFGFDGAKPISTLNQSLGEQLIDRNALWTRLASSAEQDQQIRAWFNAARQKSRAGHTVPVRISDLDPLIDSMRLIKDAAEIQLMRAAAAISVDAHIRAMRFSKPGHTEYEIEAEILHEFRRRGSEAPAYGSIVATGLNACVLHYRAGNRIGLDGELVLIDAGCELHGYASDITRTYPINGRFSGPQRAVYEIVLAAQRAAFEKCVPGARFNDPHDAAVRVLTQGLLDLRLLSGSLEHALETGSYRQFYMHRTGHWLGMDVHDVGPYRDDPLPGEKPTDRPSRLFEVGMVTTVEPGLYIRPAPNVPSHFEWIGIRIEDDLLITPQGHENLTLGAPTSADEIERVMRE